MEYQVQENCLTIFLPHELDHHNAETIRKESDHLIDRNHIRYVIFDFEQTNFMDSSGIGVIMGRYKTISLLGGEVWAVHANERIRKILVSAIKQILRPGDGGGIYDVSEPHSGRSVRCEDRRLRGGDQRHHPRV